MLAGSTNYDVVGIGNAIVDVIVRTTDDDVAALGCEKGAMTLIDAHRAEELYGHMGPAVEVSGGSAANTMAGLASLGGRAAFVGKVKADQLGAVFSHDIRAAGVAYRTGPADDGPPTARCLILVTPDAQRTMNTYLGASTELLPADVDRDLIASAAVTYLEGYLWDPPHAKDAFRAAMTAAKAAGRKVAFSLSDVFCVERWRHEFLELAEHQIDVLFANEAEICSLYETDFDTAVEAVREHCELAALTRGAAGSVIVASGATHVVPPHPVNSVVDTTGAGDLYAAGFLFGYTRGLPAGTCAGLASLAAAEVIGHIGGRPAADLAALAAQTGLLA